MKKIVNLRMRVKNYDNLTLSEQVVYGALLDTRTILAEGRYFKAGKKAGFGKSAYIYERVNGQARKVIIDHIEVID